MDAHRKALAEYDPKIERAIAGEERRQVDGVEMIPSENYTYPEVLACLGSVLTNKYAEGYPGRRYYGGQEFTDEIERTARQRATKLFRCEHANVQPLSGSPMNQAVYFAFLKPGDTVLAMDLSHGGHLTHGAPVSHMGKVFNFVRYKTFPDQGGAIDFDHLKEVAKITRPAMVLCGYSSYPRDYDYAAFKAVADEVGALTMADISHIGGLVAANVMRNPVDAGFDVVTTTTHKTLRGPRGGLVFSKAQYAKDLDRIVFPGIQGGPLMHVIAAKAVCFLEALQPEFHDYQRQIVSNARVLAQTLAGAGFRIVSGGTDNHLMLVDVFSKQVTGKQAEQALERAGITVNKNAIPFDTHPPMTASGIRIGTPAVTTRGMKEPEMRQIGGWIADVLRHLDDDAVPRRVKSEVETLTAQFPLYEKRRAPLAARVP